jgi:hypothetical protein
LPGTNTKGECDVVIAAADVHHIVEGEVRPVAGAELRHSKSEEHAEACSDNEKIFHAFNGLVKK